MRVRGFTVWHACRPHLGLAALAELERTFNAGIRYLQPPAQARDDLHQSGFSSPAARSTRNTTRLTGTLLFEDTHLPEMLRLGRCRARRVDPHADDDRQPRHDRRRSRAHRPQHAGRRRDAHRRSPTAPTRWSRPRGSLAADAATRGKTIVLTGAMVPYAFGSSDGLFNLGSALSFVAGAAAGRLHRDERPLLPVGRGAEEPRDGGVRGVTEIGNSRIHEFRNSNFLDSLSSCFRW